MSPFMATALLAGILAVDYRSSLRLLVSQPICSGLLVGLVLGSPREGFLAGALFQMIFLGNVYIRGKPIPGIPLGGVIASSMYVMLQARLGGDPSAAGNALFWSILTGILVAAAGRYAYSYWEKVSSGLASSALDQVRLGRFRRASLIHLSIMLVHFLYGAAVVILVLPAGLRLLTIVVEKTAGFETGSLAPLSLILPFIGAGALLRLHRSRSRIVWFAAGFLLTLVIVRFRG